MATGTILAIDEDRETWDNIKPHLESRGHYVRMAFGAHQGLQCLQQEPVDLVLIDDQLPDTHYLDVIKQIKSAHSIPVIVISQDQDPSKRVTGIEVGADDFLSKPFNLEELAARIKANIRLVRDVAERIASHQREGEEQPASISAIHFDKWTLDLERHELCDTDGRLVYLTNGEVRLLKTLALSPRRVIPRESLFMETRGRNQQEFDRSVDVQISRLRQKLGDDQHNGGLIKTIRGIGYMLDVETTIDT